MIYDALGVLCFRHLGSLRERVRVLAVHLLAGRPPW